MEKKGTISLLWVVVMFNMAFADILSFILPGTLQEIMSGDTGPFKITQAMLLVFAVLIEIPIAMTILCRILKRRVNRVVNIVAAAVTTAFVVAGGSTTLHYLFLAGAEVVAMLLIVLLCARWRSDSE
jgi:hypothetical protein